MFIVIGLILLVVGLVAGVGGVIANAGSGHILTDRFSLFGYEVVGSTGTLFLYGIVVGAVAMLGLSLLVAGAGRASRRGRDARRGLRDSRRETATAVQERDDLIGRRDATRTDPTTRTEPPTRTDSSLP